MGKIIRVLSCSHSSLLPAYYGVHLLMIRLIFDVSFLSTAQTLMMKKPRTMKKKKKKTVIISMTKNQ